MSVRENTKVVLNSIAEACRKCGRDPEEVQLVAVTKTVEVARIDKAIEAGIQAIGENRVQEAWQKFQEIGKRVHWHMIGHLQTNKVKRVLQFADMIQSVDSLHLAEEIQKHAEKLNRKMNVLIQVNTSGEDSKFGLAPDSAVNSVKGISDFPNLEIKGLMTIGSFLPNPEDVRPCFRKLRELKEQVNEENIPGVKLDVLSMGMTGDYHVAIEEGSTMVRVGTAIFGARN